MKIIGILSRRMIIVFAAVLMLISGVRILMAYHNNYLNIYTRQGVPKTFPSAKLTSGQKQYLEKAPMEEINFTRFHLFSGRLAGYIMGMDDLVKLEKSVKYYEKTGNKYVLAGEIPASTEITLYDSNSNYGYGLESFPTYERGWRYAKAFVTPKGTVIGGLEKNKYYYVKLSDLSALAATLIEVNDYLEYAKTVAPERTWSKEDLIRRMLFISDLQLYTAGMYCSPDFYHPYFDTPNIALLSAGGALLAAHVGAGVYLRRKRKDG